MLVAAAARLPVAGLTSSSVTPLKRCSSVCRVPSLFSSSQRSPLTVAGLTAPSSSFSRLTNACQPMESVCCCTAAKVSSMPDFPLKIHPSGSSTVSRYCAGRRFSSWKLPSAPVCTVASSADARSGVSVSVAPANACPFPSAVIVPSNVPSSTAPASGSWLLVPISTLNVGVSASLRVLPFSATRAMTVCSGS